MGLILATETHDLHRPLLLRSKLVLVAMAMVASVRVALQKHHRAPAILLQGAPGDSLVA